MEDKKIPNHIAIILDGNRRWAKDKGIVPTQGHVEGAKTLQKIVRHARKIGLKHMTVYAFSTENWKRAESEVELLMKLFKSYLDDYAEKSKENDICIKILGRRKELPKELIKSIEKAQEITRDCKSLTLNICINYGSRDEITNAAKTIAKDVQNGKLNIEDITEDTISNSLYTAGQPDPDLLIRTSGEIRLSNYLMWQLAYAEFLFVNKHWPAFEPEDLDEAINLFNQRKRRFGAN